MKRVLECHSAAGGKKGKERHAAASAGRYLALEKKDDEQ